MLTQAKIFLQVGTLGEDKVFEGSRLALAVAEPNGATPTARYIEVEEEHIKLRVEPMDVSSLQT